MLMKLVKNMVIKPVSVQVELERDGKLNNIIFHRK